LKNEDGNCSADSIKTSLYVLSGDEPAREVLMAMSPEDFLDNFGIPKSVY